MPRWESFGRTGAGPDSEKLPALLSVPVSPFVESNTGTGSTLPISAFYSGVEEYQGGGAEPQFVRHYLNSDFEP